MGSALGLRGINCSKLTKDRKNGLERHQNLSEEQCFTILHTGDIIICFAFNAYLITISPLASTWCP